MASALVFNYDFSATKSLAPSTSHFASVYSEVQNSYLDHSLPLPSVLKSSFKIVHGPSRSTTGNPGQVFVTFNSQGLAAESPALMATLDGI
ncbi:Pyrophosphate--fructose 6-phosphate 1-phosphotransferase subunit beta [Camellia lanceoleosa]|uniref:Pyrophosphate--fructose 6-phosphate 1-phosphotransferase subunit beta n=1 Tax=Camellia lanceoleosa TaxID=1840588 RepID=A0ACC0IBJ9_9ERIC|nr:Pyrophosphate--fructose 6-phosphate 1-phosphotransferase subunit beta [Camellia lanceoleosa]